MDSTSTPVLKLIVAYDGTDFWGSQRQQGKRTIQLELESALSSLAKVPVAVDLAGRTDRGVHATGQVASCKDFDPWIASPELPKAINRLVGRDLAVVCAERMSSGFHARYDARWREYRYRIWSGSHQPLLARTSWHRRAALDIDAMSSAARRLIGRHDLATFTGGGEGVPWAARATASRSTVRTISVAEVKQVAGGWGLSGDDGLSIELRIVADGFLPNVVRTIVGALDLVGRKRQPSEWISELIEVADRRQGPVTAPPQGLILWRVGYDDEQPTPESADKANPGHGS